MSLHVEPSRGKNCTRSELHEPFKPNVKGIHSSHTLLEMPKVSVPSRVHMPMGRQVRKHILTAERGTTMIAQDLKDLVARCVKRNRHMPNARRTANNENDGPGKMGKARKIGDISRGCSILYSHLPRPPQTSLRDQHTTIARSCGITSAVPSSEYPVPHNAR